MTDARRTTTSLDDKRDPATLAAALAAARNAEKEAREVQGERSRPHREAMLHRVRAERALSRAQHEAERRERLAKMTPDEVVDAAMKP
jgi:multidrug resistance efflux pump